MTLDEDIYQAVLIYSSNQKIRKLLFDNYNSRASNRSESIMNSNSDSMKNIINYRYADLSIQYLLKVKSFSHFKEMKELKSWASKIIFSSL